MSQSLYVAEITQVADGDMSAKQYKIVKPTGTVNSVTTAAAGTDALLGILQNKPSHGEAAQIRILGTSKVVAGGTVNRGNFVTSDSAGDAVATTTDGDVIIGMALEEAVDNDIFEVLVCHFRIYIA